MSTGDSPLLNRDEAVQAIQRLNEEDLRFLHRIIVERLNLISQARSTAMLARFTRGDRVFFHTASGEHIEGVVVRLNKKTASIVTDDGHQWNVHPGFLALVQPRGTTPPARLPDRR